MDIYHLFQCLQPSLPCEYSSYYIYIKLNVYIVVHPRLLNMTEGSVDFTLFVKNNDAILCK